MGLFHRNTAPAFQMGEKPPPKNVVFSPKIAFFPLLARYVLTIRCPTRRRRANSRSPRGPSPGRGRNPACQCDSVASAGFENDPVARTHIARQSTRVRSNSRLLSSTPAFFSTIATTARKRPHAPRRPPAVCKPSRKRAVICFSTSPEILVETI